MPKRKPLPGELGRIPNWAKKAVEENVAKYGFYMAFHYFIYDCDTTNLEKWEIQLWRAFDRYQRLHKIPNGKPKLPCCHSSITI